MSGEPGRSGPQGNEAGVLQATAARPAAAPAGINLDDLAERVYRLLQEDLRLGRLRQGGGR
ncbi:hypothetical protein ACFFLM_00935 [Deinococcus oregonensis]|uniref:GntR family transcriptional regulator n=1 Tax=Deinococcus oregonensis TaxID=1805970 RepID=A0ABV6ASS2_9DEIO